MVTLKHKGQLQSNQGLKSGEKNWIKRQYKYTHRNKVLNQGHFYHFTYFNNNINETNSDSVEGNIGKEIHVLKKIFIRTNT